MCTSATDKHPRGAALVIVMLVMAVLLLAGTTFLTISSTEDQIAHNQQASARALLLAEAGLHRAIAQLSASSTYAGESNVPLGSGTASITVTAASQQVCLSKDLEIVASVPVRGGNAQSRIKATADQAIYPFQWGLFAANEPLILSSLNLSLGVPRLESYDSRVGVYDPSTNGGGTVNVGARGHVILNNVELIGAAAGDPVTSSPTPVTNLGRPGDAPPSLPEPIGPWDVDPNVANNVELTLPSDTYYYDQITLGDGARLTASGGPVTIYVRGNFAAGDNVTIGAAEPGQKLSLIMNSGTAATSEFRTGNNVQLFGSLYGTNTNVSFGDNALIHGSIIGRRLSGRDSTWDDGGPCCNQKAPTLRFDRAMMRRPICSYSTFAIRWGTWREILP